MSEPIALDHAADASARLAPGEKVGPLWIIVLFGIGASLMVSALYATIKTSGQPQESATTTISYTPFETVALSVVVPGATLAAIVLGSIALRPRGLARLGMSSRCLCRGILIGVVAGVVVVPVVYLSAVLTAWFWQSIGLEHPSAHPLLSAGNELAHPTLRALIMFAAIVLAPLAEELLFRGHLQTALLYSVDPTGSETWPRVVAVVVSSIVFTIFHPGLWMMPPIFLLSICLGALYEWTRNLWVPVLIHAMFNAAMSTYYFWYHSR